MLRAPVRAGKEDSLPRPEQVPVPSHAESGEVAGEPRPDAGPGAGARLGRGRSVTRKWRWRRRACGSGGRGAVRSSRHGRRRPLCVPRAGPGRPRLARPAGPPLTRPDSKLGARRAGPASLLLHFPSPPPPAAGRAGSSRPPCSARALLAARPSALAPEPACLPACRTGGGGLEAAPMPEPGPRMNGFSLGELCWLFCCPPCPSRIAAKLAFLPPEPTYTVLAPEQRGPGAPAPASAAAAATAAAQPAPQQPEEGAGSGPGACSLHLSERADWQYSQRELDAVEVFFSRTARDNRLGCMFVRCAPSSRYTLLFSHGNAVDLGQMCSFYIGLGSRINCNIFSYDYSGYGVSSGKPSEKNLYADIDAAWQALRTRPTDDVNWIFAVREACPLGLPGTLKGFHSLRRHLRGVCWSLVRDNGDRIQSGARPQNFRVVWYGVSPENIILYGQSIGTVPTVDLASRYECAAVILHSPLMSGLRVAFPDTRKTYCFDAFPR
ncbi:alpha/beta hydrolase domain-containing protein 17C isoform X1 [Physeter macrocephalus]|uniref:Alpha/beta hydrolase domain-containing protein 17C n=1 Tax=Physeter macrocephalus TaxID=9755 RepID=A0A9W2WXB8_PHYMC|nr:alpha/beta hydrolase domain-containing protein 17C isoform X1 [Physeter catodon]